MGSCRRAVAAVLAVLWWAGAVPAAADPEVQRSADRVRIVAWFFADPTAAAAARAVVESATVDAAATAAEAATPAGPAPTAAGGEVAGPEPPGFDVVADPPAGPVARMAARTARTLAPPARPDGPPAGLVCPVPGARFTDDWGAPRSGGRRHAGNDLFAPAGSPVVAVDDAWVTKVDLVDSYVAGSGRGDLGGISVSYVTVGGDRWYNAHLRGVAAGIRPGVRVAAGTLIGWVGNTGNAAPTPPHNHIEWHPAGGPARNPFPLLRTAC